MTYERDDQDEEFDDSRGRQQSLGDYLVVADIINAFAKRVTEIWDGFTDGDSTQQEAAAQLESAAGEFSAIFKGENPYYTVAEWRTPPVLAGKIVGWVPGIGGQGDTIKLFFVFLGRQILQGCAEVQDGMAMEQAGPMLRSTLKDAAEKLAGVQP